jgi:hypothetical protein
MRAYSSKKSSSTCLMNGVVAVPLCLNIDSIESERVLIDYPVDAAVAALAERARRVRRRAPIAHGG